MPVAPGPKLSASPPPKGVDPALFARHNGSAYRTPTDLQLTPDPPSRFLVVGGCLAQPFPDVAAIINPHFKGDFVLLNNFDSIADFPPAQAALYDFQIVHIPLRTVLGHAYFRLPDDGSRHEEFLRETQECISRYLTNALKLNSANKLQTFVLGFMVPQQNPLGRFQPRYDLRNIQYFIERLNMFIAGETSRRENAYFVDVDQISSSIGKQACQDDSVWSFTHGTTLSDGDHDHDARRIQPPAPMQKHYQARWLEFFEAVLHEVFAMRRTTRQSDLVKLVAADLDDTLWRGVAAEGTLGVLEGWPMGFIEALLLLKKRGILLAIISKNDEQFIRSKWNSIVQGQIELNDFIAHKINFHNKADNLAEILRETNLRPQNAVVIDDNPVERAAIQAGVHGVRTLGSHPYYLKRVLLWSAETQQPALTVESSRKSDMVQAQLRRESVRRDLSHEEFLQSLGLKLSISVLHGTADFQMNRALELLNKTNQFNTIGARYTLAECHQRFERGACLYALEAEDRFTPYGLVGAAWVNGNHIDHMVLSCRALGLGIEDAFLSHIASRMEQSGAAVICGHLVSTPSNAPCRQLYHRNGFASSAVDSSLWSRELALPMRFPSHIAIMTREEESLELAAL